MLRLYTPIKHDIFKLQTMLQHLVCNAWCVADNNSCESKLSNDFKIIYKSYKGLQIKVNEIYKLCKALNDAEKKAIKDAFETNNKIEELCNGTIKPVYLKKLHIIVEDKMKPLLVDFYETLLERQKVPGTKSDYYIKLNEKNKFSDCPCCGMTYFEPSDSANREAFDHYLPKVLYPFASVNFHNLVPLCYKCNSDRKKTKDPIVNGKKAYYPFSKNNHEIGIKLKLDTSKNLGQLKRRELSVEFTGDKEKLETWNRLFDINNRYNESTRAFIQTFLREIKAFHKVFKDGKPKWTYEKTIDNLINIYEKDKFTDKKFLKIPLLKELKNCAGLIEVYGI